MKKTFFQITILLVILLAFTQCSKDKRETVIDNTVKGEVEAPSRDLGNGVSTQGAVKLNPTTICYLYKVTEDNKHFTEVDEDRKATIKANMMKALIKSQGIQPLLDVEATIVLRYQDEKANTLLEISIAPEEYKEEIRNEVRRKLNSMPK